MGGPAILGPATSASIGASLCKNLKLSTTRTSYVSPSDSSFARTCPSKLESQKSIRRKAARNGDADYDSLSPLAYNDIALAEQHGASCEVGRLFGMPDRHRVQRGYHRGCASDAKRSLSGPRVGCRMVHQELDLTSDGGNIFTRSVQPTFPVSCLFTSRPDYGEGTATVACRRRPLRVDLTPHPL